MIFAAIAALAAGAAAGIFLATRHFLRKRLPIWGALLHGLGGATGFVLVLLIVVRQPAFALARQALYLLIATVGLGCVNLIFHVRGIRHRTSLIAMHALCAVSGVSTLLYAAFKKDPVSAQRTTSAPTARVATVSPAVSAAPPTRVEPGAANPPSAPAAPREPDSALAPTVEHPPPQTRGAAGVLPLRAIQFHPASATISSDSASAIDEAAAYLRAHPEIRLVEVQGHADERGEDTRNVALTRARARIVVAALAARGVSPSRMSAAGYGARCPPDPSCRASIAPASCHDPARYSEARRVVFLALIVGRASYRGEVACPRAAPLIPASDRRFQALAGPR